MGDNLVMPLSLKRTLNIIVFLKLLFYSIHYRNYEVGGEVANTFSGKLQISDELGFLVLGKVDQEYICDAELREILATAELDGDKVAALKGRQLRLITSVVYSSRFQHKGMRMEKV